MIQTHQDLRGRYDVGISITKAIHNQFLRAKNRRHPVYHKTISATLSQEELHLMSEHSSHSSVEVEDCMKERESNHNFLPSSRIFTTHMLLALLAYTLQEAHIASYNTLWTMFLSEPVGDANAINLPFRFGGGAGMLPDELSWSVSIVGLVGLFVQFFIYPRINQRLGTLRMWRLFLLGFPIIYFTIPYIAVTPSTVPSAEGKQGLAVWTLIVVLQISFVLTSSCVIPSQLVLTNL